MTLKHTLGLSLVWLLLTSLAPAVSTAELRAGAAVIDVTPVQLPVLVNGSMMSRSTDQVSTRLHARAIVMDDGQERLAIVVVDSCMMPAWLLDEAKQRASQLSQVRPDRILISATHTHTAPSTFACLGTDADPRYVPYLREKLAQVVADAESRMRPAQVGWAVAQVPELTAVRRWILRSDRMQSDPFGNLTVRANMHVAANPDNVTGPSGPEDPDLAMLAIRSLDGDPIAILANFSMHYFSGEKGLSADYFGLFCDGLSNRLAPASDGQHPPQLVTIMSHGCSGDIWRRDYSQPNHPIHQIDINAYAKRMIDAAAATFRTIEFESDANLAMSEQRLRMDYRVPDRQRREWSERILAAMGDRPPKTTEEVYAREQIRLDQQQSTEVVLQAIRVGSIAIAATPTETYALTGLKLKLQSPLKKTMVIELANGACGYIPPPEQHRLGGYNTWAARSAGLEVQAEPKIVAALMDLLESVADQPRRVFSQGRSAAAGAVIQARPMAYWRLDDFTGPHAKDATGNGHSAVYEPGVVFFLEGPQTPDHCPTGEVNRAVHFVGGRLRARIPRIGDQYSVSMWCWNGMPNGARDTSGWLLSRGQDHSWDPFGDHLAVDGRSSSGSYLSFQGKLSNDPIQRWTWHHVVFVRDEDRVRIFLDGHRQTQLDTTLPKSRRLAEWFFGGRSDRVDGWEGRLDEIAIFDRALTDEEVTSLRATK